jgi:hypothetical protein
VALLNTAANRPSVLLILLRHLAQQRGKKDDVNRIVTTLSPRGLSTDGAHQTDVRDSLRSAIDLGLVERNGDEVRLAENAIGAMRGGQPAAVALLREAVLAPSVNTEGWGSQAGARDLTNALAWYLTFSAEDAPVAMEGGARSAKELQTRDFGPRQPATKGRSDEDDDGGGWPIGNDNRWRAFRFWTCSLGFAWVDPNGNLVPDPTPAVRDAIPTVVGKSSGLTARDFIDRLGGAVPVLDTGDYRQFVEANWLRPAPEQRRLSPSLTDALERLRNDGALVFDDRADAPRIKRSDGSTFSHVRRERG